MPQTNSGSRKKGFIYKMPSMTKELRCVEAKAGIELTETSDAIEIFIVISDSRSQDSDLDERLLRKGKHA